jgi:hypothetical protein
MELDRVITQRAAQVSLRAVRFGSKADIEATSPDVPLPPKADIPERDRHVRFVPNADSCTAAKTRLRRVNGALAMLKLIS